MPTKNTPAINCAYKRLEELTEDAKALVDKHWEEHYLPEGKRRRDFDDKPMVFPRFKKNRSGAPAIEWYWIRKWYKDHKGRWKKDQKYLKRGRGYRVKTVMAHAQPWEVDVIEAFEDEAEVIRQEVEILSRLIQNYNRNQKKLAARKKVKK